MTITEERTPTPEEEHEAIEILWEEAPGTPGFFASVDHKRIGMRYIYTAFIFFFIAGLQALLLRAQLTTPDSQVMGPQTYNQMFTMHGTTMIFLFNTPVLAGFGNYLLPLQLGTRDMAFPRLNAFSYWVFILAAIFMYSSYLVGRPPAGGWFAYVPNVNRTYSPGVNMDFWGLGVIFVGISTTVGAVNFIVTIFKMRAPGMTLNRMPMFVWSILAMAFMVIFAVPALTVGAVLLEGDRLFGTQFYEAAGGGSPLLYQHLFWFWGHPEVYILFVPAAGMVATIIPVFARRRLAGYKWTAASLVGISFISFGVWVHHMFATGLPALAMSFFSAASLIIAVPSGVLFFCLIATIWRGVVEWTVPFLFALGWFLIFLLGGVTGVMLGVLPFNWQATDSYFIVAHFHYVLNGAVVFPIFGALYYWLPKMTGRMLNERLGKVSFWVMFVGFHLAFFPMHVLGFLGMPRRIYTYSSGLGWETLNLVVTFGSALFGFGTLLTLGNFLVSRVRGEPAGANPWNADGLEWSTPTSPPPECNFEAIPVAAGRHPLWDSERLEETESGTDEATKSMGPSGALNRQTPIVSGLQSGPEETMEIPQPTYLPFVLALGLAVLFLGLLLKAAVVGVLGVVVAAAGMTGWLWRTEVDLQ
ncbi:MAG: cytochrome c oxidase subunit I [Actinomycetota bacterium]|nr:cytochrome c oxidase subunit I [Actinomycetota bacterium]